MRPVLATPVVSACFSQLVLPHKRSVDAWRAILKMSPYAMKRTRKKTLWLTALLAGCLALETAIGATAEQANPSTRKSPDWLKRAIVYEIFTRNFSKEGDFNAITAKLDEL